MGGSQGSWQSVSKMHFSHISGIPPPPFAKVAATVVLPAHMLSSLKPLSLIERERKLEKKRKRMERRKRRRTALDDNGVEEESREDLVEETQFNVEGYVALNNGKSPNTPSYLQGSKGFD